MKPLRLVVPLAAVIAFCMTLGCQTSDTVSPGALSLCSGCGHVKGTDACCADGQMTCTGCGLAKGSPGCCRIEKGGDPVALCAGCGHIKGTEMCCADGMPECGSCGMAKGSPGCCVVR